jgi:hypothetical protein
MVQESRCRLKLRRNCEALAASRCRFELIEDGLLVLAAPPPPAAAAARPASSAGRDRRRRRAGPTSRRMTLLDAGAQHLDDDLAAVLEAARCAPGRWTRTRAAVSSKASSTASTGLSPGLLDQRPRLGRWERAGPGPAAARAPARCRRAAGRAGSRASGRTSRRSGPRSSSARRMRSPRLPCARRNQFQGSRCSRKLSGRSGLSVNRIASSR